MADPEHRRVHTDLPDRTVAQTTSEDQLKLIIGQSEVLDGEQHFVADLEGPGTAPPLRREDHVVLCRRKVPVARPPASHLELNEFIGATIVKPVHHPTWLDRACRRVVRQYVHGQPLIHDLADLLGPAVRQNDAGRIVEAPKHDAYLFPDLVDEDHDGARAGDGGGELAQRL